MTQLTLKDLGWSSHFQSQLSDEDLTLMPVRVCAVHRDAIEVAGEDTETRISPVHPDDNTEPATVGDWLLLNSQTLRIMRILDRRSVFRRKTAGSARKTQLIAANVDTMLLVTSANADFNIARLERYLALAADAGVTPVIIITKADLVQDTAPFTNQARQLMRGIVVEAVDARDEKSLACLSPWFGRGQTLAVVGSSGVGKSTIVNALSSGASRLTQAIREDDAKGRHTTTGRSLHRLANGAWLMDTPGMRELQLVDVADGIDEVFADLATLAGSCRFTDCQHAGEPGCAIGAALDAGALDAERLKRYAKLQREERRNAETLAQSHARSRNFGRKAKQVFAHKLRNREW